MNNIVTNDRLKTTLFTGHLTRGQYDRITNYPELHELYQKGFNAMIRVIVSHGYDTLLFHRYGWFEQLFLDAIGPIRTKATDYFLMCVPLTEGDIVSTRKAHEAFDAVVPLYDERLGQDEHYDLLVEGCSWVMHHDPDKTTSSQGLIKTALSRGIRTTAMDLPFPWFPAMR